MKKNKKHKAAGMKQKIMKDDKGCKTIEISQDLRHKMKKVLTENRFDHTLGVAYTAASMAFIYDVDIKKAITAGMLHDCAKCISHDDQISICNENNVTLTSFELDNQQLLHAKTGECLARIRYGIDDQDILDSIRFHTTGRPEMSMLDKIIFTADFIEPNRKLIKELDIIRKEAFTDIDKCVCHILANTIEYLKADGKEIDPVTLETYAYYKESNQNEL